MFCELAVTNNIFKKEKKKGRKYAKWNSNHGYVSKSGDDVLGRGGWGKVEWVCMWFVIEFPQPVNSSHQQPLSHGPISLTSIQSSDSLHIKEYFNIQIKKTCTENDSVLYKLFKSIFRQCTDAFRNNLMLTYNDNKILMSEIPFYDT